MKIKKLIINNIASIENATIDFDAAPLADADIFLITGRIGSGKTTLLDCICLALYGQTPRLPERDNGHESSDDWGYSDPRRCVRRNAPGGSTTLLFETESAVYEAHWSVSVYTKGEFKGQLNKIIWTVKNLTTGAFFDKKKEVAKYLNDVIGLDFNQFCRTTMLAQGEFSQFLKSSDKEKAAILQKITGVDIYQRIGRAVSEATSEARRERDALQISLDAHSVLSDDERCLIASQLAANSALQTAYRDLLQDATHNLQWLKNYNSLKAKYESALTAYNQAKTESKTEDVAYSRRLLDVYDRTSTVRARMSERRNSQATIDKTGVEAARLDEKRKDIEHRLTELGDNFNLANARTERDLLKDQQTAIENAKSKCRILNLADKNLADNEKSIKDAHDIENKNTPLIDAAEVELKVLDASVEAYNVAAEALRLAAGDEAERLRLGMKAGCKCPVCRQTVDKIPSSSDLQVQYDNAVQRANEARRKRNAKDREISNLKAIVAQAKKAQQTCSAKTAELQQQANSARLDATEACTKAQCTIATLPEAINLLPGIDSQIKKLSRDITKGESIEKELVDLNLKIVANNAQQTAAEANVQRLDKLILLFKSENPDISELDMADIAKHSDRSIADLRKKIEGIDRTVVRTQSTLSTATDELSAIKKTRPAQLNPDTTVIDLIKQSDIYQQKISGLADGAGRLRQQLEADAKSRSTRADIESRLLIATNTYELHQRLNNMIGDKDGKNFSRIALSYVLGSLIENANVYLQRLTDRYTLRVEPGSYVIVVCDSWHDYTERTVNTTSGGEKFLISLALALALTDIGLVRGMDTLFIDEGFGSLSEDDMRRAIDALASMHKVAGRQVGIISHVAALRDRIPVQIHVDGAPNHPSTVTVTG